MVVHRKSCRHEGPPLRPRLRPLQGHRRSVQVPFLLDLSLLQMTSRSSSFLPTYDSPMHPVSARILLRVHRSLSLSRQKQLS